MEMLECVLWCPLLEHFCLVGCPRYVSLCSCWVSGSELASTPVLVFVSSWRRLSKWDPSSSCGIHSSFDTEVDQAWDRFYKIWNILFVISGKKEKRSALCSSLFKELNDASCLRGKVCQRQAEKMSWSWGLLQGGVTAFHLWVKGMIIVRAITILYKSDLLCHNLYTCTGVSDMFCSICIPGSSPLPGDPGLRKCGRFIGASSRELRPVIDLVVRERIN